MRRQGACCCKQLCGEGLRTQVHPRGKHCLHQLWPRSLAIKGDTGGSQGCAQVFLHLGKAQKQQWASERVPVLPLCPPQERHCALFCGGAVTLFACIKVCNNSYHCHHNQVVEFPRPATGNLHNTLQQQAGVLLSYITDGACRIKTHCLYCRSSAEQAQACCPVWEQRHPAQIWALVPEQ